MTTFGNRRIFSGWPLKSLYFFLFLILIAVLTSCAQDLPESASIGPVTLRLLVDGQSHSLTTESTTVRELLNEAGIVLNEFDEVTPPLFTPLEGNLEITVVRITEITDTVLQGIPFERKIVRNESMDANAPPIILQGGKTGLQEETVRIVYRDGLESERWVTQVTLIEPAQDEIVMIGIGAARGNVTFEGILSYISDGTAVILRGLTAFPEQLDVGGNLDGRVFQLSPSGSHLLYTRSAPDTTRFNNGLWVISTERDAKPRYLEIENVLWAGWNPSSATQIAYTTATPTSLPPGWEANNDLWIGNIPTNDDEPFESEQRVEVYPATYGWWGGNYAWSPTGAYVAYSYANEVGMIDINSENLDETHIELQRFTEYNTLQDWVWVPTLSWSPDGRFLSFTNHGGDDPEEMVFDSWIVDVSNGVSGRFIEQSGMWAHLNWAPANDDPTSNMQDEKLVYLKSSDPLDSLRSSYTLWVMDQDGSNKRQIYPSPGENSYFPREQQFMAWSPDGRDVTFIFDDDLFMLNLDNQETRRITQDDAINSHPTWAPYGLGLTPPSPTIQEEESDSTPIPNQIEDILPEDLP